MVLLAVGGGAWAGEGNVVPLVVRTPLGGFNRLVVRVTVCVPGTERCAVIDDVMVDTGSTGLRLEQSALPPGLQLPAFTGADGRALGECVRFVHDAAWGALFRADLRIGGMVAGNLPIQVISDGGEPQPGGCPVSTARATANGTLGIGPHLLDCRGTCLQDAGRPGVFVWESGGWMPVRGAVPAERRLPNPVASFPVHGNGVVFDIPAAPADGTGEIAGTLTFGVGTAANNHVAGARILRLDGRGMFTTRYRGVDYPDSYIDSGTETLILADPDLPRCVGMDWAFCVSPERRLEAGLVGADGGVVPAGFTVGDYRGALDRRVGAWDGFAEVAAGSSRAFVWGRRSSLGAGSGWCSMVGVVGGFYVLP